MSYRPVFFTIGILLLILSAAMIIPVIIDWSHQNNDWKVFAGSQCVTGFFGLALVLSTRQEKATMNIKQAFLLTNLSWITISVFGALPFYFSDLGMTYTDSFFESVSGITTTGSTILNDIEVLPPGILFWRSILQWLGGVGIMVMALSVLPLLQVGGMQLFKAESFEIEKVLPSAAKIATYIGMLYILFTFVCAILYKFFGMSGFDAFAHALTTIATGGYFTYNDSFGHFDSAALDYICIAFMWIGSLPFVLYLHVVRGNYGNFLFDSQVSWFFVVIFSLATLAILYLVFTGQYGFFDALRYSLFNITSIVTGTGYATTDYTLWGGFIVGMIFFASCIGGCAGSTTGGIKIFRFQVLYAVARSQTLKMIHPHGIFPAYYNKRQIPREIPIAVMSFFFIFALSFSVLAVALLAVGLDYLTAMSSALTSIANVGPALGDIAGPAGNFSTFPDSAKWIMCVGMLLGRLELFTFFVMLSPRFWRN